MTTSELRQHLTTLDDASVPIKNPDGTAYPAHFHVTELGEITKTFIDCGGTRRDVRTAALQLWVATDTEHRLSPKKLIGVLDMVTRQLDLDGLEIEVESQGGGTIQKYGLAPTPGGFQLTTTATACLAQEACGAPEVKAPSTKSGMVNLLASTNTCTPGGGCC